jgi:hypothetical protein
MVTNVVEIPDQDRVLFVVCCAVASWKCSCCSCECRAGIVVVRLGWGWFRSRNGETRKHESPHGQKLKRVKTFFLSSAATFCMFITITITRQDDEECDNRQAALLPVVARASALVQ